MVPSLLASLYETILLPYLEPEIFFNNLRIVHYLNLQKEGEASAGEKLINFLGHHW